MQPQDGILGVDAYSIRAAINLYIKPGHQKETAKLFRKAYDFFRHADTDTRESYELKDIEVDSFLMLAVFSCENLGIKQTQFMEIFMWWLCIKYPNWLKKDDAAFIKMIEKLRVSVSVLSKKEYFLLSCTTREINIP